MSEWYNVMFEGRQFRLGYCADHSRCIQEQITDSWKRCYWRTVNQRHYRSRSIAFRVFAAFPTKKSLIADVRNTEYWGCLLPLQAALTQPERTAP